MASLALLALLCASDPEFTLQVKSLKTKATDELQGATDDLALAKRARVNAVYSGPKKTDNGFVLSSGDEKRAAIAHFESEMGHWKSILKGQVVPLQSGDLAVGDIGLAVGAENLVKQVLSDRSVIVDLNPPESRRRLVQGANSSPRALERGTQEAASSFEQARKNAESIPYSASRLLWIDMPTNGLLDGATIAIDKPIVIIGTKTYGTVSGGTKSILRAKALTEDDLVEYRRIMIGK